MPMVASLNRRATMSGLVEESLGYATTNPFGIAAGMPRPILREGLSRDVRCPRDHGQSALPYFVIADLSGRSMNYRHEGIAGCRRAFSAFNSS